FFISACMLTYAYAGLKRDGWRRFYWRRFVSVGVPYLCWTVIYFLWFPYVLHSADYTNTASSALAHFGHLLEVGYNQLYFLIVIMEFYLLFPLVLWLLRRTKGHHGLVLAAAVAAQFAMAIGMHWKLLPDVVVAYGQENAACYVGYLAGMYLVRPWRSRRTKAAVRIGSDNAYGIYLAQMIFITSLGALGWTTFVGRAPFYVWLPLTVAIAYFGCILLTALLARTPLAVPLTGRKQQPWRTLLPRRA